MSRQATQIGGKGTDPRAAAQLASRPEGVWGTGHRGQRGLRAHRSLAVYTVEESRTLPRGVTAGEHKEGGTCATECST